MDGRVAKIARIMTTVVMVVIFMASCSTTKKIPEGEELYNGLKLNIKTPDNSKVPDGMRSDLINSINVKPNNPWPLLKPYRRNIFPIGLWVYNNWNDSAKGLKGWLYRKLVSEPCW